MKVIQLRGTNATGKTTAIRQFIEHGQFTIQSIEVEKAPIEYHWEERRRIAILGRYDTRVTGGIDGRITDKNLLKFAIIKMIKTVRPDVLLFEGIVYGVTYKFAYELARILRGLGADYTGICFMPPLEVVFMRLEQRNGGKVVNYMSVQNKWFTAQSAYKRLKQSGVNVKAIDTTKVPKADMYKIIEEEL